MSREKIVFFPQPLRDVPADDPLRQALDDRSLADARFADQHGVVLGLARQDLDDPADLGVPTDHGVELAGAGVHHQVPAILLQRLVGPLRGGGSDPLIAAHRGQHGEEGFPVDAMFGQQAPGRAGRALLGQREQQVFHRNVGILEALGFSLGRLEQTGQPLRDINLAGRGAGSGHPRPPGQVALQCLGQRTDIGARRLQKTGDESALLLQKCQQ